MYKLSNWLFAVTFVTPPALLVLTCPTPRLPLHDPQQVARRASPGHTIPDGEPLAKPSGERSLAAS